MSRCPAPIDTSSKREVIDAKYKWTVPTIEVEKLLEFSSRLTLDGEITPVEAWARIKGHPNFVELDQKRLDMLKAVLVPEVLCYGCGVCA
jgi:hypothetical protein